MARALSGPPSAALSVERFFQFSLLGLVASGYLAVAGSGYLDLPTIVLTACGLLVRALVVTGVVRLHIPPRITTALALAYVGFYPVDYLWISGGVLEATVHLVFFLAVLQLLTANSPRAYLFTAIIAFLELLAGALLSVNLNFFVFLALYLLFTAAAFSSAEIRRAMDHRQQIARLPVRSFSPRLAFAAFALTMGILTLTAGLFFLLPRTADAALRHLVSHSYYLPGFSNQVNLGAIGEVKTRSTAVMHVRFYGEEKDSNLKWRGAALTDFDGKKWFNPSNAARLLKVERGQVLLGFDPLRPRGRRLLYRVDLRAIDSDVLFLAGLPERLNYLSYPNLIQTEDDGYRLGLAPPNGVRYEVSSYLEPPIPFGRQTNAGADMGYAAPAALRRSYLQLPPLDPRIPVLARSMTAGYPAPLAKAQAIEDRLRRDFGYTLDLPSKELADPLAHFLFERKKGHCEYFASAMTVMLRTLGIPARLVNGFQSGIYNPMSDQYVIRASDAHSWVEAYLPGRGWTTFDPTPPDPTPRSSSLLTTLMLFADAAETFWQEWVVGYNQGRQVTLAEKIGHSTWRFSGLWREQVSQRSAGWVKKLITAWEQHHVAAVALFSLGMAALLAGPSIWKRLRLHGKLRRVRRGIASSSDATILYQQFLETFHKKGFEKPPWYTALEFARTLERSNAADLARNFTDAYNEFRFGGRTANALRLSLLLDEVKKRGK